MLKLKDQIQTIFDIINISLHYVMHKEINI